MIVSDNCSADGTRAFIESLYDRRVQNVSICRRVRVWGNWEFAPSHVDDGWVMFLGEDDGLLPGAIARLTPIIETTGCEAITFRGCNFIRSNPDSSNPSRVIIPFCKGQEVRVASHWLGRVIDSRTDYSNLPVIYVLGPVHLPLPRAMRSSIVLARFVPKYLYVNEALTIVRSFATSGKSGEEGEYRRFVSEDNIPFHPDIPLAHLYSPKQYDALNQEWGRDFARLQGLDFNAARAHAKSLRRRSKIGSLLLRLRSPFECLVIYDRSVSLNDAHAASPVAGAAQWAWRSIITRLRHAVLFVVQRFVYELRAPTG